MIWRIFLKDGAMFSSTDKDVAGAVFIPDEGVPLLDIRTAEAGQKIAGILERRQLDERKGCCE